MIEGIYVHHHVHFTKLKKTTLFYETFCYVLIVYIYVILIGHLIHALHNLGQPGSEGTIVYHTNKKIYNTNLQIMCYT